MSRVITFSIFYPNHHPRNGQCTYFVEKVVKSLHLQDVEPFDVEGDFSEVMYYLVDPKHHTIRAGHRWKEGDKFSPRVWSGKPYHSKQIQFAPDIEVKKTWDFEIKDSDNGILWINKKAITVDQLEVLAKNDGLNSDDLLAWFQYPKDFDGQIISWNDTIEY